MFTFNLLMVIALSMNCCHSWMLSGDILLGVAWHIVITWEVYNGGVVINRGRLGGGVVINRRSLGVGKLLGIRNPNLLKT